ncbi:hypothetical protein MMC17_003551 [Xylographa soralifera]|nr:hypothetical protein [Xylographa soralifera]
MEYTKPATIKLPLNLHMVYKALKQETNSVATWLILNGGNEDEAKVGQEAEHECNVADLLPFAGNALEKGKLIPHRFYESLAFVVNARAEISLWYKTFVKGSNKERKRNKSHDHLTLVLRSILEMCSAFKIVLDYVPGSQRNTVHVATLPAVGLPGRFNILYGLNDGESEPALAISGSLSEVPPFKEENDLYELKDKPSVVRDDGMTDKLKLVLAVMDLDTALAEIQGYWTETAKGVMLPMLAICLTNYHVFLAKEALAESLKQLHMSTIEELVIAYQNVVEPTALISSDTIFTSGAGFSVPVEALQVLGTFYRSSKVPSELLKVKRTFEKRDCHSAGIMKILSAICEWRLKGTDRPGTPSVRTWIYNNYKPENLAASKIGKSVPKRLTTQTEVVVDLEILYGISASYAWNLTPTIASPVPSGRDASIIFAAEILRSIKSVKNRFLYSGASDPLRTLNAQFEKRVLDMSTRKALTDQPYLDHPWIAGIDDWVMCQNAALLGCLMAVNKHLLTVLLHSYNAARKIGWLQEVPILERLCNDLEMAIFRELRPTSGFASCFYRLIGSKVEHRPDPEGFVSLIGATNTKHRGRKAATVPTSRSFNLTFPTSSWKIRPHAMDISLTHACNNNWSGSSDAVLTKNGWARVQKKLANQNTPALEHKNQTSARMYEYRRAIEPEFIGDLPVAGINYYAMFSACENALREVGKRHKIQCEGDPNNTIVDEGFYVALGFILNADDPPKGCIEILRTLLFEPIIQEFQGDFSLRLLSSALYVHDLTNYLLLIQTEIQLTSSGRASCLQERKLPWRGLMKSQSSETCSPIS